MSDDLTNKIKQIADMLGAPEGMPDNIKGLISLLANSASQGNTAESSSTNPESQTSHEERASKNELDENLEMMRRMKKIMDRMSTANDPRVNLLTAVKPFLNNKRQKKLNNAIKILMMSNMARFVDDLEKGI